MTLKRSTRLALVSTFLLAEGISVAAPSAAQRALTAAPTSAEAGLLDAENQRLQAQVTRNMDVIAGSVADEAIYTHANGRVQSKTEYVEAIRSGRIPFKSVTTSDRFARVSGDLGMVHGTQRLIVGDMHLADTYLAVYVKRAGHWQLLSWQSAPMFKPEDSSPPGPAGTGPAPKPR